MQTEYDAAMDRLQTAIERIENLPSRSFATSATMANLMIDYDAGKLHSENISLIEVWIDRLETQFQSELNEDECGIDNNEDEPFNEYEEMLADMVSRLESWLEQCDEGEAEYRSSSDNLDEHAYLVDSWRASDKIKKWLEDNDIEFTDEQLDLITERAMELMESEITSEYSSSSFDVDFDSFTETECEYQIDASQVYHHFEDEECEQLVTDAMSKCGFDMSQKYPCINRYTYAGVTIHWGVNEDTLFEIVDEVCETKLTVDYTAFSVTRDDSYASGNCEPGTERFIKLMSISGDSIRADKLMEIAESASRFERVLVKRAIRKAYARHLASLEAANE